MRIRCKEEETTWLPPASAHVDTVRIPDGVAIETVPAVVVPERVKAKTAQVTATKEPRMGRGEGGIRHEIAGVTMTSRVKLDTTLARHLTHTPGVAATDTPFPTPTSGVGVRNGAWFFWGLLAWLVWLVCLRPCFRADEG